MILAEMNYKKTIIEYLPEVLEHWAIIRVKNIFDEVDERSISGKEDLLSVSQYTSVTPRKDNFEEGKEITNAKTLKGYKIVEQGDLVINIMLAWNGCLGISHYNGITSPAYCVYRIKGNHNAEYFGYLFSTSLYKGEFRKRSTGIIESRLRLYSDAFFKIYCLVPPIEEQNKIVNFINTESIKINYFIQSKQHFIELLKEQRQSIITNAVTKGIDINTKMKVTVLGEIPEHWEVRRLGTIGRFSKGGNISRSELIFTGEGVPAILYGDIYTKYDIIAENIINRITKETAAKSIELKKGDLLFTGSGETKEDIGKCVFFKSNEPAYAGGDVIIFKQKICDSYFISYSQNSSIAKYQKAISSKGEIIVHTYGSKLRDVFMPYPPTIDEQKQIVKHIKTETRALDIAINKAEREIELMKEYLEAMITEVVTGKMKI